MLELGTSLARRLGRRITAPARRLYQERLKPWQLQRRYGLASAKYAYEVHYWQQRYEAEGGQFGNSWYEKIMLAMAAQSDAAFLAGKVVADFGCGPRGSLIWATGAGRRIGIDVLAADYARLFGVHRHAMDYVTCTERQIPLESDSVDVLFSLNALDHVDDFATMCQELVRIMRPGALLAGSFNLDEEPTMCEPLTLTTELVEQHLLRHLEPERRWIRSKGPGNDIYRYLLDCRDDGPQQPPRVLWVLARKPAA